MSFWSGEALGERLPGLVTPFDPAQIDCAAYRLRVGPEVYVSPTEQAKDAKTRTKVALDPGEAFAIPPGQFAFLLTEERVTVPNTSVAFISVRATVKFRGLVNVSGFHVDPGYNGRLVFSVFNAGPAPVHLARGDDCFLIWYADLDRATAFTKTGGGFDGIPTKLINPIAGEIQSLAGLLSKIEATEKRVAAIGHEQIFVRAIGLIIVAGLVGLFFREVIEPRMAAVNEVRSTDLAAPRPAIPAQSLTSGRGSDTKIEPRAPPPTTPDKR